MRATSVVVGINGRTFSSIDSVLRNAISTLIKDFRSCDREETEWARAFLEQDSVGDDEIAAQIELMILIYCPEVPEQYIPFMVEALGAAIRLARRDRAAGLSPQRRKIRLETMSIGA
jgi:hypothetical protein